MRYARRNFQRDFKESYMLGAGRGDGKARANVRQYRTDLRVQLISAWGGSTDFSQLPTGRVYLVYFLAYGSWPCKTKGFRHQYKPSEKFAFVSDC